jgi:hypothetical protein
LKTCAQFLRDLVGRAGGENPPLVNVCTDTHSHDGIPVKIQTVGGHDLLALFDPKQESLTLLALHDVKSVTLLNSRPHLGAISKKGPWSVATADAPSRLNIERALKDLPRPTSIDWDGNDGEPAARVHMAALVRALAAFLPRLSSDALGKEAMAAVTKLELRFVPDGTLQARKKAATLQIEIGYGADLQKLDDDLRTVIEKQL